MIIDFTEIRGYPHYCLFVTSIFSSGYHFKKYILYQNLYMVIKHKINWNTFPIYIVRIMTFTNTLIKEYERFRIFYHRISLIKWLFILCNVTQRMNDSTWNIFVFFNNETNNHAIFNTHEIKIYCGVTNK